MTVSTTESEHDLEGLLYLTTNPADRLWRYPICHALVKYAASEFASRYWRRFDPNPFLA